VAILLLDCRDVSGLLLQLASQLGIRPLMTSGLESSGPILKEKSKGKVYQKG